MSSTVIICCDICGRSETLKVAAPIDSYKYDQELHQLGWWSRPDFSEICPSHPQQVSGVESPEKYAHIIFKREYAPGEPFETLCGSDWTPTRPTLDLPICAHCVAVFKNYDAPRAVERVIAP